MRPEGNPWARRCSTAAALPSSSTRRRRQQQAIVERHAREPEHDRAAGRIRLAVAEPAGHADLAGRIAVGAERLAQAEHAGRDRQPPDPAARIVGRGRQAEQLGVGEDSPLGVDVARDGGVGFSVAVEVDRLAIEVDVDVAVPAEPDEASPVVGVGVDQRRRRIAGARAFKRPDVLDRLLAVLRSRVRRGWTTRPAGGIDHVRQKRLGQWRSGTGRHLDRGRRS